MKLWQNIIAYQLLWMVTVAGAAHGLWWAGVPVLLAFALWQWRASRVPRTDIKLVAISAVVGFGVDSAFAASQLLHYQSPMPSAMLAPIWILVLWMGFALTLNHSMQFLRGRMAWAVAFGAVGGPIAYLAADRFWGAVRFDQPLWQAVIAIAIAWAIVTPLLVLSAERMSREEELPA